MAGAAKRNGPARRRKLQPGGKGRAVATRRRRQSAKAKPKVAPRGRGSGKGGATVMQGPLELVRAVRYPAPAHTPRWPAAAYARVGTDCAGLEVVMSVMEDLKIETRHVFTLVRLSC